MGGKRSREEITGMTKVRDEGQKCGVRDCGKSIAERRERNAAVDPNKSNHPREKVVQQSMIELISSSPPKVEIKVLKVLRIKRR